MRANGRILAAQAYAALPTSSSIAMRTLSVRMARVSLAGTVARPAPSSVRLLHNSSSSSAEPSTSAAEAPAKEIEVLDIPIPAALEATADLSSMPDVDMTSGSVAPAATPVTLPTGRWTPASQRVGLIAKKKGMTSYFMPDGRRVPATIVQVSANAISQQIGFELPQFDPRGAPIAPRKALSRMAYTALQVAATNVKSAHAVKKPQRMHLSKAGIHWPKMVMHEFRVTRDAIIPLGTELSAAHFVPGQTVDVVGITRGKGFAGVMKRHNFKGQGASHGNSKAHRSAGSTGQNQDPGRVWPGKKMAGNMGNKQSTKKNLQVLRVDTVNDIILLHGNIPGADGSHVYLTDSMKLTKRAARMFETGRLSSKEMVTGNEPAAAFLPKDVLDLPFPAVTRDMVKQGLLPDVIELAPEQNRE